MKKLKCYCPFCRKDYMTLYNGNKIESGTMQCDCGAVFAKPDPQEKTASEEPVDKKHKNSI